MRNWTTIAASSFVAVAMLALPVGAAGQGRHAPEGAPSSGTAEPRGGGDSGGSSSSGSSSGGTSAMPRVSYPSTPSESDGRSARTAAARRERGDRPQVGTAGQRTRPLFQDTPYQYTTRPYPYWWYSAYAPGFGYAGYDLWSWGRRPGPWWDPGYGGYGLYGLDPYGLGYGFGGYGGYGGYSGSSYSSRSERDFGRPSGSIRLRVSPRDAKVYVDGALVGTVD